MTLQSRNLRRQRRSLWGFTLLELLIVIAIILLLVIATLPRLKQALDESKLREGSRQLNSYFAMAKSRAATTGRPCGVWFVGEPVGDPTATPALWQSRQFYLAETPPPYSGDFLESRAWITDSSGNNLATAANGPNWRINFVNAPGGLLTLIGNGDNFQIRFDHKGPYFTGWRNPADGLFYIIAPALTVPPTANGFYNANTNPLAGYQFEIVRIPQRIGAPLTLPQGTSVDLNYSGFGSTGVNFLTESNPVGQLIARVPSLPAVLLMFSPDGHVDSVSYFTWDTNVSQYRLVSGNPQGTTHFLVGRPEKVLNFSVGIPPAANSNITDNDALWVSVARLTGSVTTTDNGFTNNPNLLPMTPTFSDYLFNAREYARNQDVKGGR